MLSLGPGLQIKTPIARSSLSVSPTLVELLVPPVSSSQLFSHPPALNLPYLRIEQPSLLLLLYIFSHACPITPPKPYASTASGPSI